MHDASLHTDAATAKSPAVRHAAPALRELKDLPAPSGWPIVGNLFQGKPTSAHLMFERLAREMGPVFRYQLGTRAVLVVGELELVQKVLQERPHTYRRITPFEKVLPELGVDTVFSAEGSAWQRQRKLVMPAFSMKQQRDVFPIVTRTTEDLLAHWQKAAASRAIGDARTDLMRYAVDVTSQVVFGHELGTLRGVQPELQTHLSRIFHHMQVRVNALLPYWRVLRLPADRAVDRSVKIVQAFVAELIAKARAELQRDPSLGERSQNLLYAMLAAQRAENPADRLSDSVVAGNMLGFLLAGEDTTSNTMTWMVHYMAHHPQIQKRLREEACAVLGDDLVPTRYEDVVKLKYAAAVTQEALRLRAAAPLNPVETVHDTELGGIALPKGTWVLTLMRHCGLAEQHFSDAQRFNPERWLAPPSDGASHNARAALAFGGGPRTCPGRSLALLECHVVAAMIARNFEVQPISGIHEVEERLDFAMAPNGLRVRFKAL